MNSLEQRLAGALKSAHISSKAELGFGMPSLLRMVEEWGPADAARKILSQPTDMFTQLFLSHRLDLSVEAIVLREEFRTLFTSDELHLASERLRESHYEAVPEQESWAKLAHKARDQWAQENPY